MSTVFSPSPTALGRADRGRRHTMDTARGLASFLLAAAVAALVLLANQFIEVWSDGHLFAAWVTLWVVIFAGSVLFAGTARRLARRTVAGLDGWSRAMAEARAEVRMWELAKRDPRLRAEFMHAVATASVRAEPAPDVKPASDARLRVTEHQLSSNALMGTPTTVERTGVGHGPRFVPYV